MAGSWLSSSKLGTFDDTYSMLKKARDLSKNTNSPKAFCHASFQLGTFFFNTYQVPKQSLSPKGKAHSGSFQQNEHTGT